MTQEPMDCVTTNYVGARPEALRESHDRRERV